MDIPNLDNEALKTILQECRQCGTCCKRYKKVVLQGNEVEFINNSFLGLFGSDAYLLLGQNSFGQELEKGAR